MITSDGRTIVWPNDGQRDGFIDLIRATSKILGISSLMCLAVAVPSLEGSATPAAASGPSQGYLMAGSDGGAFDYGNVPFENSLPNEHVTPSAPITDVVLTSDQQGYWMVGGDGNVYAFGDASYQGGELSTGSVMVGIASGPANVSGYPTNGSYWLLSANGGVFAKGGATFHGAATSYVTQCGTGCSAVAIASTPDRGGYWVVLNTGSVYTFGDAGFYGPYSPIGATNIVGLAQTSDGDGYWLVGKDGGVFTYGDAPFYGSYGGGSLPQDVTGIAGTPDNGGYWLSRSGGAVLSFGDAAFLGDEEFVVLGGPIVGIA